MPKAAALLVVKEVKQIWGWGGSYKSTGINGPKEKKKDKEERKEKRGLKEITEIWREFLQKTCLFP